MSELKICYGCSKVLTGDYVHIANGEVLYDGTNGKGIDICINCLYEGPEPEECTRCDCALETDGSDTVTDGDGNAFCKSCAEYLSLSDWSANDNEDRSTDACGGRNCSDCLLKGTDNCIV